jgi:hypothetical protein
MRFKVGDTVKVREDLVAWKMYGSERVTNKMLEFKGHICIIAKAANTYYFLEEDEKKYYWTDEMLEPAEEKNCNNCAKYITSLYSCDRCHRENDYRHWQPKQPEQVIKNQVKQIAEENERQCKTCKHQSETLTKEPCKSCDEDLLDKWEENDKKSLNKAMIHEFICHELTETYKRKNNDYGDSFAVLRKEYDDAILIRIFDKYNRLKTLKSGTQQQVDDESIRDSLVDLANYCIMELVEMEVDKCQ